MGYGADLPDNSIAMIEIIPVDNLQWLLKELVHWDKKPVGIYRGWKENKNDIFKTAVLYRDRWKQTDFC